MHRERTAQQLDPIGNASVFRAIAVAAAICALLLAAVMSIASSAETRFAAAETFALLALVGAAVTHVRASDPFRAPYTRLSYLQVLVLLACAIAANELAQFGTNTHIRNDWGPIAALMILASVGPFRPAVEQALGTVAIAGWTVFAATLALPTLVTAAPAFLFPIIAATPIAAGGVAAAVWSRFLVRRMAEARTPEEPTDVAAAALERAVLDERRNMLDDEVLPFLEHVLSAGALTSRDVDSARTLASVLRERLVAEHDETWLQTMGFAVDDHDRMAPRMTLEQRRALHELLSTARPGGFVGTGSSVRFLVQDTTVHVSLRARVPASERQSRARMAAPVARVRVVFPSVRLQRRPDVVMMDFAYRIS